MARSCSTSASASGTVSGNGEPRPADDLEKRQRTQPGVVSLEHLLQGPDAAPPEYLTLSLTPAGEVQPREQPGEVTLKHIDAPRDYLKPSLAPSDEDELCAGPNADRASSGGSVVQEDSSAASSDVVETALVIVDAIAPPAANANSILPPKKRKFAACVYQGTPGTSAPASSSSSRSSSLAIVVRGNDGETRSPAAMDCQPIDAVPLQAVCVRGRVWRPLGLCDGAGEIPRKDAASTSSSTTTAAPFSTYPIGAVPLRAAWCSYVPLAAGAASGVAGHHRVPPEPSWTRIRAELGLLPDHQLHFIAHKRVERSDLDLQQSRLLIPRGEAARLIPLLSDEGRRAANLDRPWKRPKRQAPGSNNESSEEKKARAQGKKHGGLVMPVYINRAGDRMDAQLTRWTSNGNTVLKFGNHKSFVDVSGLQAMDEIQLWAFQNPGLCLVITKIDGGETTSAAEGGQQSKPPSIV
ncbi:hypothetical protein CFC21_086751 [Triticum aestivum]|uniref:Uncharacterized protein n=2 Tax=Triticum aestivum TaxID=4565 RepID=A0A3B6PIN3_WHEAT|nr:hypothetical protein CFC21_086751 [Triticum aestivum]